MGYAVIRRVLVELDRRFGEAFDIADDASVARQIRATEPQVLLVAMSSPRKEYFLGEHGRDVYELMDLGFGRCTMVMASEAGPDPAVESLRRLGVMRVATKYPRIAARHLEETGRQGEIVEVKGSVELAPLTGMVDAIVDLTATGTTLRENNLVVREEIVLCTARLIANPVAHKLKAAQIDALLAALRDLTVASSS